MRDIVRWVIHWLSSSAVSVTPAERTFIVKQEIRAFIVPEEDRVFEVPNEIRSFSA